MFRIIVLLFLYTCLSTLFAEELPLHLLKLPPGFKIQIYAKVPGARSMALGEKGTVFIGTKEDGKVYALIPDTPNQAQVKIITIASNLNTPNGVAFYKGALYVAEIDRILRFDDIEKHLNHPLKKPTIIHDSLLKEEEHGWRYIDFGPDGKLYISIGVPCNVCLSKDSRFGTIMRMNPDGSNVEIYAKGIRNSVGFDWDPLTGKLWFTENGRDWLGDNTPPDKLNYAPIANMNFGFPFYDGKNLPNSNYIKYASSDEFTMPTFELPAHVAPLGMSFYTGKMFPNEYANTIFIAEHGSWNRSTKVGYQVIQVLLNKNRDNVTEVKPFITGWLQGQKAWGRPVATLVMPDGALLISDDYAGVVYRVSYK